MGAWVAAVASSPAAAVSACDGMDTSLTDSRKHEYAQLVASAIGEKIEPRQVDITAFMQSGTWSAVYVSTPETDDGVLFFQEKQGHKEFEDVWGGWADPSERAEVVQWARDLGAPKDLSGCFAQLVTAG